jgi:predicted AAA+ superfamily ATPase
MIDLKSVKEKVAVTDRYSLHIGVLLSFYPGSRSYINKVIDNVTNNVRRNLAPSIMSDLW